MWRNGVAEKKLCKNFESLVDTNLFNVNFETSSYNLHFFSLRLLIPMMESITKRIWEKAVPTLMPSACKVPFSPLWYDVTGGRTHDLPLSRQTLYRSTTEAVKKVKEAIWKL